jgi:prevent-host-death family protein
MDKSVYTQLMTLLAEWMKKAISAADANRRFSPLLRDVREGQSYVVTSHRRPVASIAPVQTRADR